MDTDDLARTWAVGNDYAFIMVADKQKRDRVHVLRKYARIRTYVRTRIWEMAV